MIDNLFKDAVLIDEGTPPLAGVSNVIQLTAKYDALLVYASSEDQLNTLLENYLPKDFQGLLIAPFKPKKVLNYTLKPHDQMRVIESSLIDYFYPQPETLPFIVGVTGTNGKTSVAWTVVEVARLTGKKGLYAGTPGVFINGDKKEDKVATTTPSYLDLRKLLFKYAADVNMFAIEVSSHALFQNRLKGLVLDAAGWSNFTQDHLDFHKTMEEYFKAKKKIVELTKDGIVFFPKEESDLKNKANFKKGASAKSLDDYAINNLPEVFKEGFPKTNLELALTLYEYCLPLGKPLDLKSLELPPGRFQKIERKGRLFIVDYAHTPDAIKSVLSQVKESFDKKIVTVFGCGGDRDRTKRPLMARAAEQGSDMLIITSDNPRSEKPESITDDIIEGITSIPYKVEVDRKKAIELACQETNESWVVLVAGKGHEDYQEISGVKYPFNDAEVIKEVLK